MNYIDEINAFDQWLESNFLPPMSQLLWYRMFHMFNRARWGWVQVENERLMQLIKIKHEKTFIDYRDELIKNNLIEFKRGKKGCPNKYRMISICTSKNEVHPTVYTPANPTVQPPVNTPDTNKQNKIKENNKEIPLQNKQQINYQKIQQEYNRICVDFPKCTRLSDKRKSAIAARIHSGYSVDDFIKLFETAQHSDFLKGKNNRNWRADFDWLVCDANMAKTLDGKYENRQATQPTGTMQKDYSGGENFLDFVPEGDST